MPKTTKKPRKKTRRMNVPALRKFQKLLLADAKKKNGITFDMGTWGSVDVPSSAIIGFGTVNQQKAKKYIKLDCGTRACALGLAALSGKFPNLDYHVHSSGYIDVINKKTKHKDGQAGAEVFGLTNAQADWLFGHMDSKHITGAAAEREVAGRIDQLIKFRNWKEPKLPKMPPWLKVQESEAA